jgi:hypothetical protein
MVAIPESDPDAGGPPARDVISYAEAMGRELAMLCEEAGAREAARRFRQAADALAQPEDAKAAPGEAA